MKMNETVAGVTITAKTEGVDQATSKVKQLASETENLGVVSEQTAKRTLSLEDAWKRQTLRLDEVARAQANIAREMKLPIQMLKEGRIDAEQYAERVNLINQRYNVASTSTQKFAQQTGLARHELINLGRQAQDVGVSLVSGQSPLMVLAQQGSQIADVFISSGKSVGSFFGQAIGWAGRFVTSTAGVVTGLAAIAAGAVAMGTSFASAQKDIERALSATGGASGITRGGINRIAEQAAGGGMSVAQARETATAFAATSKIYEQNALQATKVTRDFARVMEIELPDATKTMTAAMLDPSKGALDLEKQLNFLDVKTLDYIRTLQSMGDLQGAQKALLDALNVSVQKQMGNVGGANDAWQSFKATLSDVADKASNVVAVLFEVATGIEATRGFTDEQRLGRAQERQQTLRAVDTANMNPRVVNAYREAVAAADAEVAKLQQRLAAFAALSADKKFAQMGLEAEAFAQSLFPSIQQVQNLTTQIANLEQLKAEARARGGDLLPNQQAALDVLNGQLLTQKEIVGIEQRKAQVFAETAARYPEVSAAVAQILDIQKAELKVAEAIGEEAKLRAQYELDVLRSKQQGLTVDEQTNIAKGNKKQAETINETTRAQKEAKQATRDINNETRIYSGELANTTPFIQAFGRAYGDYMDYARDAQTMLRLEEKAVNDAAKAYQAAAKAKEGFWGKTIPQAVDERLSLLPTQFEGQKGTFAWNPLYARELSEQFTEGATKAAKDALQAAKDGMQAVTDSMNGIGDLAQDLHDAIQQQEDDIRARTRKTFATGDSYLDTIMFGTIDEMIVAMKGNTKATDSNTEKMTDVLSSLYSSDPRQTHLGFRAFARGGIMTAHGELPLKHYQGGGIATSPQVAIFGEGSTPEAYVPAPGGQIPVVIKTPANNNQRPITVNINIRGNADGNTVAALKSTAFQQAQAMRRVKA